MNTLQLLFQQAWISRLGWTLLHFLWQGTLIAVVFAVVRALAGQWLTARARYALTCLALGIMMATPVITFVTAQSLDGPALTVLWPKSASGGWQQSLPWLVAIWLAGVIVFTVRLIGGWRLTARLRSIAIGPVPAEWQESLEDLIRRMKISTPVRLLTSSLVAVPTVVGWLRPVILMPIGALAGLPLDQVEALLAHELAHIRRQDYVVNILQSIAEVVLFYHPAVWWVSEQIRAERETCCDDLAVEASGDVLVYVRALTDLEANRRAELRLKTALAADGGSLVNRIRRLVQEPQPATHSLAGPGAAWALSVLWLAGIGAATMHAAPAPSVRAFVPAQRVAAVRLNPAAQAQFPVPPEIKIVAAPLLTALMFDPFFDPPQAPAPAQPAPDSSQQAKISVSGVVQSTTHEALKKANVRLQMIGGPSGQMPFAYSESTDDAGKFTFENIAPGTYSLTGSKMGFVAGAYGARAAGLPGATITLDSGATLTKLEVTLTPQGIVAGRVTNQDGDPVTRVQVALYRSTYARGRKVIQLDPALRGQANDLGAFTIANVTPGRYYLRVNSGDQPPDLKPGMADVTTFYPNSLDVTGAVLISVAAGARVEAMDVRLRREHVYSAAGKITMNGAIVKNLVLELSQPNSGASASAGTARLVGAMDGTFMVRGLFPGSYSLAVSRGVANPQQGPGHSGKLDFSITGSDLKDLELNLTPGVEVSGTFQVDGGKWADLFASSSSTQTTAQGATPPTFYPSVGLVDPDIGFFQNPMRVSAEGTFKLRTVPADRYLLDITGLPQNTYVKSIRYGTQDVTRSPVDFVVGGGTLDITLSKNAATVSGIVRSDKGDTLAGVQVTLWPKNPNPGLGTGGVRSIYTDQNGSFRVGNLAPGDYFVAAWDELDSGLAQAPEFLGRFISQATAVKVNESSQANADVKMVPKDGIAKEVAAFQ
jgi:beta-lactamase regulating signal transducer with metallopeptidase domain